MNWKSVFVALLFGLAGIAAVCLASTNAWARKGPKLNLIDPREGEVDRPQSPRRERGRGKKV